MTFEKPLPTIEEEINRLEMMAEICHANSELHEEFKQYANFLRELVELRRSYAAVRAALEQIIRQKRELEATCITLKTLLQESQSGHSRHQDPDRGLIQL